MEKTIVGVFGSSRDAEAVITELKQAGVDDKHISYVATTHETSTIVSEPSDKADSNAARGAGAGLATGAVIGTIAGLAVANGVLPGIGTLFVAGPIAAALGLSGAAATAAAGAMTGAAAGGLLGAFTGLGINDEEAIKLYERRIEEGGFLVAATAGAKVGLREIFDRHGAEELREYE